MTRRIAMLLGTVLLAALVALPGCTVTLRAPESALKAGAAEADTVQAPGGAKIWNAWSLDAEAKRAVADPENKMKWLVMKRDKTGKLHLSAIYDQKPEQP